MSVIQAIQSAPSTEALDRFMDLRPKNHRNRKLWEEAADRRRRQLSAARLQQLSREIIARDGNEDRIRRMAYECEVKASRERKHADISFPSATEIAAELFKRKIATFPFNSNRAGKTELASFTFHANKQGAGKSILGMLLKSTVWMGRNKCPFCGSISVRVTRRPGDLYDVTCQDCIATGPLALNIQQALSDWNKRS